MKSTTQGKIPLPFFATLCTVAVTLFFFFPLSRAGQPEGAGDISGSVVPGPGVIAENGEVSPIERRKKEEKKARESAFAIAFYRQNYFLFVTYDSDPNRETYEFANVDKPENLEVKFQISLKVLLWEKMFEGKGELFFGYTQRSFWQLYDKTLSSPFRETNYEPEMFLSFDTDFNLFGLRHRLLSFGLNHQSNGRGKPLSRSWNRIFAEFVADRGNFVISLKPWFRIPESTADDTNPDMERFMGYGELFAAYRKNGHVFSIMVRNNLRGDGNRGAFDLGWSFQVTRNLKGYVQYFYGYGESLVDYNDASNRIGIGVMLNDWI